MSLIQLDIHQFRNYSLSKTRLHPKFNFLTGKNGSGKTSFLEAIYLLGLGRSFRTRRAIPLIQHETSACYLSGEIQVHPQRTSRIGIQKTRGGDTQIRIDQEDGKGVVDLLALLPLQLLHHETFELLTAGPKRRRQFLDWGVFHVEPSFFPAWTQMARALKQRNAALRQQAATSQIQLWDRVLIEHADRLDAFRREYLERFQTVLNTILPPLLKEVGECQITYHRGWPSDVDLNTVLNDTLARDRIIKHTQHGPHRADLAIKINHLPAEQVLSRGQQKLLIYALSIAQAQLLLEWRGQRCIYLIDDLPAELDGDNLLKVFEQLKNLETQVFITGIELEPLTATLSKEEYALFHVEHGEITTLSFPQN